MKKILYTAAFLIGGLANMNAVPLIVNNLSNGSTYAYDAHFYLGVRLPSQTCSQDTAIYYVVTAGSSQSFVGNTPWINPWIPGNDSCIQGFLGVNCAAPAIDVVWSGMRFYLEPYSATFPMNNSISGIDKSLHCHPDHPNLTYTALGYEISNPLGTGQTKLSFLDLGVMQQYVFQ
ncbi:hypothetical protein QW060_00295 [Myroides ceti]|uniref:Uncharacterized protein n=1 Tax=Paenimyroides ceti TaxID=395087 RepID=A0ABT8CQS4_9FLAO|nr:hypothetical protein [Paenimyroides ceti]MDN3705577.1 hypothetical protein [Paenimyroides ceti]